MGRLNIQVGFLALLVISLQHTTFAERESYFLSGVTATGGWRDINKSPLDEDDDYMCWAASASNILDWGGWRTSTYSDAQSIFNNFKYYWTDQGCWPRYAWDWWITSAEPPNREGWARVEFSGGGGYFPGVNFYNVFGQWGFDQSDPGILDMVAVESCLRNGQGVSLAVRNYGWCHALTVWGVEYETNFSYNPYRYTGFWATDSDDNASQLVYFRVDYVAQGDFIRDVWWVYSDLDPDWQGWIIAMQALKPNPHPFEPYPGFGNTPLRIWIPDLQQYNTYIQLDQQQLFYAVNYDCHPDMPLNPQPIPEPSGLVLGILGLSLMVGIRRRDMKCNRWPHCRSTMAGPDRQCLHLHIGRLRFGGSGPQSGLAQA